MIFNEKYIKKSYFVLSTIYTLYENKIEKDIFLMFKVYYEW